MSILYYSNQRYGWHNQGTMKSIYDEMLSRFYDMILIDRSKIKSILDHIHKYKPRQIWLSSSRLKILRDHLKVIRKKRIPVVGFGFSEPALLVPDRLADCDYYFTNSWKVWKIYMKKMKIFYNPPACDFRFHRTIDVEKIFDITFIGAMKHRAFKNKYHRRELVANLRARGIKLHCFGKGWDENISRLNHPEVRGYKFLDIINKSHLGLDIQGIENNLAHRIFEYAACGVPIITRIRKETERNFKSNVNILTYYNEKSLVKLLSKYIPDKKRLRKIGSKAKVHCIKRHNISHRVDDILTNVQLPTSNFSKKVNPLFFLMMDQCIIKYLQMNDSIRDINKKYPFIVISSNLSEGVIQKYLPGCIHIHSSQNAFPFKLQLFLEYIKKRPLNYNVAYRLDLDCIVFDVKKLLKMGQKIIGKKIIAGNYCIEYRPYFTRKLGGCYAGYIRGGCNMTTKESLNSIDRVSIENYRRRDFDICYNSHLYKTGTHPMSLYTFEFNAKYQGNLPAWHPSKLNGEQRRIIFRKHVSLYRSRRETNQS